ncbi:MAG: hypothetical protein LBL21_03410 [Rickettsiales bacterium]|nr:hypothetical protein [Rickettsiales bacterium]
MPLATIAITRQKRKTKFFVTPAKAGAHCAAGLSAGFAGNDIKTDTILRTVLYTIIIAIIIIFFTLLNQFAQAAGVQSAARKAESCATAWAQPSAQYIEQ